MASTTKQVHSFIVEKAKDILLDVNLTAKRLGITLEDVNASLAELCESNVICSQKVTRSVVSIHIN